MANDRRRQCRRRLGRFAGAGVRRPTGRAETVTPHGFHGGCPPGTKPPIVDDIDEAYYFKPDASRLLCSPADETPQQPGDAKPDGLEIARAIDAINTATTLDIRHVRSAWAGLRTFTDDRTPVVGYDPDITGLFWCAGQGGYGIQTAPALARTAAALVREDRLPADVAARGVTPACLAKARFE